MVSNPTVCRYSPMGNTECQSAWNRRAIGMVLGCLTILTPNAWATNGMLPIGTGVAQRGVGGAGVADPLNTMSMATNPAAASFIADGYDVGLELFQPNREVTFKGKAYGAPVDQTADGNGDDLFLIPEAGYKRKLNEKVAAGVVVYATGGMNTAFEQGLPFGSGYFSGATPAKTGINFEQLFVAPTISYKVNEQIAVGASANVVSQRFKAEGLEAFAAFSSDSSNLSGRGYDTATGIGASIGVQGNVSDKLSLGASYRSKVNMSKLDKYKGLFPDGGELDVPAVATVGAAYQATPKTTVVADIAQIAYSDVAAIGNATAKTVPFGAAEGPGFAWNDQTVYKVGVRHQVRPDMSLSAGFNHGESPITSSNTTVNTLAPGVVEDHVTLGMEKRLSPKAKLQASYIHALEKTVKGNATLSSSPIPLDAYDLKMDQNAVGVAYSVQF